MSGWLQLALLVAVVVALTPLLGGYMARVFAGERVLLSPLLGPVERLLLRAMRVRRDEDGPVGQDWKAYGRSVLLFSFASWLVLYALLRLQSVLPGAPKDMGAMPWDVTFNTASSFVTNTNWQYYGGETTLSSVSQMTGLAVQNFVSAAVGIVVLIAVVRGIAARGGDPSSRRFGSLGNFWVDLVRAVLYVLLPISFLGALVFVSQGALQTLGGETTLNTLAGGTQTLVRGPVASQEAIKLLGTNGGGYFNVNSAMPFENPTAFSNFLSMVLVLAIPAALTATYGRMVGNRRQGWAIFGAMAVMFVALAVVLSLAEQHGSPAQHAAGLATASFDGSTGGNLVGKEQRFGISGSALFNTVTTVTSTGAVNSAMESLTGLGGLVPMTGMGSSEVIFGGVGSGLYGMLLFVVLAVFVGGLMVGRTPELHGKKIEAREIKLAMLGALYMPLTVLTMTALAVGTDHGKVSNAAGGPQGFSEALYASLSQGNNNGSAFAGYTGFVQPNGNNDGAFGITFADLLGGVAMLVVRFFPILVVLALAGSLARKRPAPTGPGTLRTDSPTFVVLLIGVIVLVGALTFFPAFLLGPVVQSLTGHLY
ncbi:potassium-transporting ATPase subunit KdpA [Patulibacter americanus]|uniref:potassium-transporting ATPase subunit KdpA n=1 Tax=Patulibacter americanus TaxID=588672 RepID=UPI0003B69E87|nr:potassium-transporting ATPase subunit KdpA [Patulibacter americanus]